jgi:hypothetical protein
VSAEPSVGGIAVVAVMTAWALAVIARSVRLVYRAGWVRVGLLSTALLLGSIALNWFAPHFWYAPRHEAEAAAGPRVNTEWTYYAQSRLISKAKALAGVAPTRPGIGELYFVGFARTCVNTFLTDIDLKIG